MIKLKIENYLNKLTTINFIITILFKKSYHEHFIYSEFSLKTKIQLILFHERFRRDESNPN